MATLYGDLVVPEFKLLKGDCLETLKDVPDNSIDAVLCDPPYHLQSIQKRFSAEDASPVPEHRGALHRLSKGFMGKTWDGGDIAFRTDVWKECYRVLKPGGHLVAFGGTRTIHRITCAIEDSGFEIRDMISWLYFSGFPKSHNISISLEKKYAGMSHRGTGVRHAVGQEHLASGTTNQEMPPFIPTDPDAIKWQGWGTALKPAQEPACLARKPIEKGFSIAENVKKWGTGALNIDKSRFSNNDPCWVGPQEELKSSITYGAKFKTALRELDNGGFNSPDRKHEIDPHPLGRWPANIYQCPKPGKTEKEAGLDHLQGIAGHEAVNRKEGSAGLQNPRAGAGRTSREVKNTHPTVKPVGLFGWLAGLICPEGGTILDPFLGSGTTAVSGLINGYNVIGCELTPEYWPIIDGRVKYALEKWHDNNRQYKLF